MAASALLTDLYQLTMLQSYYEEGMEETAVFEFFVRRLPAHRNFLLFAGLEQVLEYIENLRFSQDELEWLEQSGRFDAGFIDRLEQFRFSGDIHAMAEGSVFFPDEPVLRVTAALPEAQLIESRLINILHYQTLIASKAARCRLVAPEKTLVDFGMRRAHGAEAALLAARANYIAGFDGTATVQAEQDFGIPLFGTMAHAYIQSHQSESQAFENYAHSHPDNVVLLIDTYDTRRGAEKVVNLAQSLKTEGVSVKAVRLDSGDLPEVSASVRRILDDGDCRDISIFASGDLDEYGLAELINNDCPIDAFGIGTRLNISRDSPSLDCVYKLQEYAGQARRKKSVGKSTWPGRKQVYRQRTNSGSFDGDLVTLADDARGEGEALIEPVMRNGQRIKPAETLEHIRKRSSDQLASLPEQLRVLDDSAKPYPVEMSQELMDLAEQVDKQFTRD
ncbi:MAG: nicotinate phosphoribosyltransferase [Woeseiaceae bacterium]